MKGFAMNVPVIRPQYLFVLSWLIATSLMSAGLPQDIKGVRSRIQHKDVSVLETAKSMLWSNDPPSFYIVSDSLIKSNWEQADDLIKNYLENSSDSRGIEKMLIDLRQLPSADRFKHVLITLVTKYKDDTNLIVPAAIAVLQKTDGPEVKQCLLEVLHHHTDISVRSSALDVLADKDPIVHSKELLRILHEDKRLYAFHHKQQMMKKDMAERHAMATVKAPPLSAVEKEQLADKLQAEMLRDSSEILRRVHATYVADKTFFDDLVSLYRNATNTQVRANLLLSMMAASEDLCAQFLIDEVKRNPGGIRDVMDSIRDMISKHPVNKPVK